MHNEILNDSKLKRCSHCGKSLLASLSNFPPDKRSKDGYSAWCRICSRKSSKNWRDKTREYLATNKVTLEKSTSKSCTKCGNVLPATTEYFPPNKTSKDGLLSWCRECKRTQNCISTKQYHQNNPEYYKTWRKENHEAINKAKIKWRHDNPEKSKQHSLTWKAKNKDAVRINSKAYDKRVRKATPKDTELRKEVREIYATCPEGYHVDHIIPLNSELVCGLHVPQNLQHLPAIENELKSNKFTPYVETTNV